MPGESDHIELTAAEVDALLSKLCSKLGFCLPAEECERFRTSPPSDLREFTNQVFRAEGLDPAEAETALWRKVRDLIVDAFEAHLVRNDAGNDWHRSPGVRRPRFP